MVRRKRSQEKRSDIFLSYGYLCVYCEEEKATILDHVLPYDWNHDDTDSNLVPSCYRCNAIASDKMFNSFKDKKDYIKSQIKGRRSARRMEFKKSICTNCGVEYDPRNIWGSTAFLCEDCVDVEYKRKPKNPRKRRKDSKTENDEY